MIISIKILKKIPKVPSGSAYPTHQKLMNKESLVGF
jgi:hypothetical protein